MATRNGRPHVVIVGAGFGGLHAARALRRLPVRVTLVDAHNYHLFQPLLYQVATALLDPSEIAYPVRAVARRQRNCRFLLARVEGIDLAARTVTTTRGTLSYDHLVLAAGAVTDDLGMPGVAERTFGLKSLGDALALRNHLLTCVENAASSDDLGTRRRLLTVAVVGAGTTGVELAGAVSELSNLLLRKDFRNEPEVSGRVRIVLVEAGQNTLSTFAPRLQRAAARTLQRKGVELRLATAVRDVDETGLLLAGGEVIPAATVIWTVGVRGSPLGAQLGLEVSPRGRLRTDAELRLPGHPEVFVIGDLAEVLEDGRPLPMLAPVAIQQGRHVARVLDAELHGQPAPPFRYVDKGTMATIGRNAAVAQIGPLRLAGFPGWVTWLFVHLMLLVGYRNRAITLLNWALDYFFYDRPVRLIAEPARRQPRADASPR